MGNRTSNASSVATSVVAAASPPRPRSPRQASPPRPRSPRTKCEQIKENRIKTTQLKGEANRKGKEAGKTQNKKLLEDAKNILVRANAIDSTADLLCRQAGMCSGWYYDAHDKQKRQICPPGGKKRGEY